MKSPLKTILLALMFGLSGCSALDRLSSSPPTTNADLQTETQRLQDMIEEQNSRLSQQQADLTNQLDSDRKTILAEIEKLEQALKALQGTAPPPVVITEKNCPAPPRGQTTDGKLILGSAEWVWLDAADQAFNTRIDTGADTSSISADEITIFERNSKKWVSFYISHHDIGERIQIKAPLVRRIRVRQASTKKFDRRPVVMLSVRVGGQNEKAEFSLTDRSNMKFPMLLGRTFLKDIAVVDVGRKYIQPKPRLKDVR
jgi:hypothetical protein